MYLSILTLLKLFFIESKKTTKFLVDEQSQSCFLIDLCYQTYLEVIIYLSAYHYFINCIKNINFNYQTQRLLFFDIILIIFYY